MDTEEIQKLILQVEGDMRLRELNKELANEIKLMADLKALFAGMPQQAAVFDQQMALSTQKLNALGAEILKIQEADAQTGGEGGGGGFKFRGGMRADLVLTHAFRSLADESTTLSEKLERVSQVTPWVLNMFGAGGAWVMGLALAATAVIELYTHWNDLMAALGNTAPREAAKAIEEMADRTKKAIEEFKKSAGMPVGEEGEVTSVYKKMATGPGAEQLKAQLLQAIQATGAGAQVTEKEKAWWTNETPDMTPDIKAIYVARRAEIMARITAEDTAQAQRIISETHAGKDLETREEARKRLAMLVGKAPKAFAPGFGADLEAMTPEGIERDTAASDAAEEAFDAANQAWRAHKASQTQKRRERDQVQKQDAADMDEGRKMQIRETERKGHEAQRFFDQHARELERADQQAERGRPLAQAQQAVGQAARGQGIDLSPAQTLDAAREALGAVSRGVDANTAILGSIADVINHSQQLQAKLQQQISAFREQQNRLGMGPDNSGQFSAASAWEAGW